MSEGAPAREASIDLVRGADVLLMLFVVRRGGVLRGAGGRLQP